MTTRLRDCLDSRVAAGLISKDKADMMEALSDELEREYREQMAPDLAGAAAVAEAARIIAEKANFRKRQAALQIVAQDRVIRQVRAHSKGVSAGAMAMLVRDIWEEGTGINVETQVEVVLGQLQRRFVTGLEAYSSKSAGLVQDKIGIRNLVKALYGEPVSDGVASKAAKEWKATSDFAVQRYTAAGGELMAREDWHLPQIHDEERIRSAGYEAWRDTILPLLDDRTWKRLEEMRQELAGERGQVDAALAAAQKDAEQARLRANGAKREFEAARGTVKNAEGRIGQLTRQLQEVERELEAQRGRAMEQMLASRERRMDAVGQAAADADALLLDPETARAAARRGDARASRDRTRASEADTAITRLETRRDELRRQLNAQTARRADADERSKGLGGQRQAYEEDLRRAENTIADLERNRRIINKRIDGEPAAISPAHREDVLRFIFDQIITDLPPAARTGQMAASKHNARRFFIFKNADAWLAYNDAFGSGRGGIYDVLTGHMEAMARDIALTEVLGPKPAATMRLLVEEAAKEHATKAGLARANPLHAFQSPAALVRTYDVLSGRLGGGSTGLATGLLAGLRNWLTAGKLGSAIITAVPSDSVTAAWASKWNGMPAGRTLATALNGMNPQQALRMGIVSSALTDQGIAGKRYADEVMGRGFSGRVASFVIRAQGMAAWTQRLKNAFMMEMMGHIADNVLHPFPALSKPLQRMLKRYGVTPGEWDVIRAAPLQDVGGAKFFDPEAVSDRRLGEKLMQAIIQERGFAVLEPNARVRQLTTAGLSANTFMGQVARSAFMFKSFAVTMMLTHMWRGAIQAGVASKLGYFAGLTSMLTVAGAMAIQAKSLIQGKDPRPMNDVAFWGAAMLQGGALGFFGDFLSTATGRDGNTIVTGLLGPVVGFGNDAGRLAFPNLRQLYEGEPSDFGAELARFVRYNAPGSNIWYGRLALDRVLWDQVQIMADPDWRRSFQRMERRARKDFGQRYWWGPGDLLPERAPDLTNIAPD